MLIEQPSTSFTKRTAARFDSYVEQFYGNWIWRATHALLDHQDFNGSANWLAQKLGISVEDAVNALEGLEFLGLLQKTENGFSAKQASFLLPQPSKELDVQMIKDHRVVSEQILNKMVTGNFQGFRTIFSASNKDLVLKLCKDFWQQLDEFKANSKDCETKDGVFGVTFSAVQLSNESTPEDN